MQIKVKVQSFEEVRVFDQSSFFTRLNKPDTMKSNARLNVFIKSRNNTKKHFSQHILLINETIFEKCARLRKTSLILSYTKIQGNF